MLLPASVDIQSDVGIQSQSTLCSLILICRFMWLKVPCLLISSMPPKIITFPEQDSDKPVGLLLILLLPTLEIMACNMFSAAAQSSLARIPTMGIDKSQVKMPGFIKQNQVLIGKSPVHSGSAKVFCSAASLEEEFSAIQSKNFSPEEESDSKASQEETVERLPTSEELQALLADSQRTTLVKKLSEANQQNRFLKRQLQAKEDVLIDFKSELAVVELEIQALVGLAEELAKYDIPKGSRKINGKYIQSHLLSRLEAVQKRLEEQTKDVEAAQSNEVHLFWHGMAESVQVMGSFDGWSQGEHLSPEYTGSYTTFSTTLLLRPGRYEIKFLVDGEWHLSPEFPTVGEGMMQNNLLIVE
ncbi:PROTEIN TARGETING TO STARCH [Perilla frutescens var. hirtella]|uniref:PROTEIN TARGETING TO STARCH n=1 Tax=Perilla frutescens var. hirtella TaxID=608512 RepID=A0AAD4JGN4_PERFH|nr:PROTEIN TARGETING TO STARCH [Perilla frutescens var. frutescens]KAH6800837.1 PROTEIN TARGETING TO STARCH [Perilla frutescens var. hirtella]KAH6833488.1 PROTEIN TARGETING TO STARCH [Perilla frutescens var. hirtella]